MVIIWTEDKSKQIFKKMDECVSNHQLLLSENYIVQPVEGIPVSVIDYEKMEMTHLIHPGQLTSSVIQLADVNSQLKGKVLHPLEAEIQRDLELKQQQALSKHQPPSVIQTASHLGQEQYLNKPRCLEQPNSLLDGVMQLQSVSDQRETLLNVQETKEQENSMCHISPINRQMVLGKRQFIIVSDNSMLFNIESKENKEQMQEVVEDCKNDEISRKSEVPQLLETLDNYKSSETNKTEPINESDSENEGDDIEPVFDYEPDPDSSATINVDQDEKPNKCYMCFKSFRQKKNMYAHIRKIHSTQPKIEGGILCPLCKMHALRQEHLRNHLEILHDIRIEKEEKLFNTMEEFLSWKEFTEKETLSLYVSKSSSKLLANNQQKTYYKCHRSGNYVTLKKENRKKKLKVQGSNKIGATCPAAMEITENIHGINVTFWKTHVGHENDLAHLVLSREDKAKIMDYVAAGVPWDKIIENINTEKTKASNVPSRLTMVSKQDLRNIKKIHEMKTSPDLFSSRKKIIQGRKPVKERMLRRASQSLVIEKADMLLNLLETTDVRPEFRPKICMMIDNLISTVKRRTVKGPKRENISQRRRQGLRHSHSEDEKEQLTENKSAPNSTEESHTEDSMDCNNSAERSFFKQTNAIRTSKRNSMREGTQAKVISKLCH